MAESIRVGVLGLGEAGQQVIETVQQSGCAAVVAVADRNRETATRYGRLLGVDAFDDFRLFLYSQPLDALLVNQPPFGCHEALRLAASRHIAVWRRPPLARSFESATQLVSWFSESSTPLVVGRLWPRRAAWLQPEALRETLGQVFLAHAHIIGRQTDDLGWRGDRERAGGGALLDQGYDALDLCLTFMGLPDTVMATVTRLPGGAAARVRQDTEDAAVVLLQFGREAAAGVTVCWRAAPPMRHVVLYGHRGTVLLEQTRLRHVALDGQERSATELDDGVDPYAVSVREFLEDAASPSVTPASNAREHLKTMAVIEAAYLSARTGEPESPLRLFEMQGWPFEGTS